MGRIRDFFDSIFYGAINSINDAISESLENSLKKDKEYKEALKNAKESSNDIANAFEKFSENKEEIIEEIKNDHPERYGGHDKWTGLVEEIYNKNNGDYRKSLEDCIKDTRLSLIDEETSMKKFRGILNRHDID